MGETRYTVEAVRPRMEAFLGSVLNRLRVRAKFTVGGNDHPHPDFENPEVLVRFTGPDVELLLANRAELLLALEHLTLEMLRVPQEDHSRLCFDADDCRRLRIEELRMNAGSAAEMVKSSRRPFQFQPMNSRERRILHLALRGEPAVRSESAGAEPYRHVVVYPAGMPSLPERPAGPPPPRGRRR